jgi:hypothetical protein
VSPEETQHDATPEKRAVVVEAAEDDEWPPWAETFLVNIERSPNASRAAEQAGVDRSTPYRLRDRSERFALAWHDAREKALDRLEEVVYALGTAGLASKKTVTKIDGDGKIIEVTETEEIVRSPTLAMFFLKRWRPEYREAFRVEQTGANGGPIRHEIGLVEELAGKARADLDRLHAEQHELPELPPA